MAGAEPAPEWGSRHKGSFTAAQDTPWGTALCPDSHTGSPCAGRDVDVHMQTASLLLSPQTVVCDTRGFGLLLGDAEDGSKLRSRPFQSAQVPPEMGTENRFKWGCCVQGRCDPCCPLEQSQSILRADTIQSTVGSSATPQESERTQTKQMSNAFFLLTGHREIREILLKCCVSTVRCCQRPLTPTQQHLSLPLVTSLL